MKRPKSITAAGLFVMTVIVSVLSTACSHSGMSGRLAQDVRDFPSVPTSFHDLDHALRSSPQASPRGSTERLPDRDTPADWIHAGAPAGTCYIESRSTGERQILALALKGGVQDEWVYFNSFSLWVDVGTNESRNSVTTNFNPVRDILASVADRPLQVYVYRVHSVGAHSGGRICPPDSAEISEFAYIKHELRKRFGVDAVAKLVDECGMWTYEILDESEHLFFRPDFTAEFPGSNPEIGAVGHLSGMKVSSDRRAELLDILDATLDRIANDPALTRDQRISEYLKAAKHLGVFAGYAMM